MAFYGADREKAEKELYFADRILKDMQHLETIKLVYPEEKEKVQQIVIEEMEKAYTMKVPLLADCGWGTNWLEAH